MGQIKNRVSQPPPVIQVIPQVHALACPVNIEQVIEPALSLYEEQVRKQEEIDKQHNAMLEKLNRDYREKVDRLHEEKIDLEMKQAELQKQLEAKAQVDKVIAQVEKNTVKIKTMTREDQRKKEQAKFDRLSRGKSSIAH